jgi:NADPH:quinone reductase-like Zn-dependent oxidoreductase
MSAPHLANYRTARKAQAVRTTGGASIDALVFDEVTVPEPGPGEVLVAIKAVSLNFRDLAVVTGRYPRNVSQPTIIASDGSGEVIATGDAVTAFKTGDCVAGSFFQNWINGPFDREYGASALGGAIDGVLTQFRVFPQEGLVRIPEHFSYQEGATLPCAGLTAWKSLPAAMKSWREPGRWGPTRPSITRRRLTGTRKCCDSRAAKAWTSFSKWAEEKPSRGP